MIPSDNPKITFMTTYQIPTTSSGINAIYANSTTGTTIIHMTSSICHPLLKSSEKLRSEARKVYFCGPLTSPFFEGKGEA
jgi:hypothetical protein